MRKGIIGLVLMMMPMVVLAEYNQAKIKDAVESAEEIYNIQNWKRSKTKDVWLTREVDKIDGYVLSVGPSDSGIILPFESMSDALTSMQRCWTLGYIGLQAKSEEERREAADIVMDIASAEGLQDDVTRNDVTFNVMLIELGGTAMLTCSIYPAA